MRSGKADRLITIRTFTLGRDAAGGQIKVWADLAQVWAEKIPIDGKEILTGGALTPTAQIHLKLVSYRNDFDEKAQIVLDGKTYSIAYIGEIRRREGLDVLIKFP